LTFEFLRKYGHVRVNSKKTLMNFQKKNVQ
jgi:hypothetical protein